MSRPTQRMLEAAIALSVRPDPDFLDHDELLKVAAACHYIGAELAFAYQGLQRKSLQRLCDYTNPRIANGTIPLLPLPRIASGNLVLKALVVVLPIIVLGKARKPFGRGLGKAASSCRRRLWRFQPYDTRDRGRVVQSSAADESLPLSPPTLEQTSSTTDKVQDASSEQADSTSDKVAEALPKQANLVMDKMGEASPNPVLEKAAIGHSSVEISSVRFEAPADSRFSSDQVFSDFVKPFSTMKPSEPLSDSESLAGSESLADTESLSNSESLSDQPERASGHGETVTDEYVAACGDVAACGTAAACGGAAPRGDAVACGDAVAYGNLKAVAETLPEDTRTSHSMRQESMASSQVNTDSAPELEGTQRIERCCTPCVDSLVPWMDLLIHGSRRRQWRHPTSG
ncbi:MAG: hypothetical protein Q9170_007983 [Blastenia crenularia]